MLLLPPPWLLTLLCIFVIWSKSLHTILGSILWFFTESVVDCMNSFWKRWVQAFYILKPPYYYYCSLQTLLQVAFFCLSYHNKIVLSVHDQMQVGIISNSLQHQEELFEVKCFFIFQNFSSFISQTLPEGQSQHNITCNMNATLLEQTISLLDELC